MMKQTLTTMLRTLSYKCKTQTGNIASLQADLLNQQIIAQHHSKFIQDNLPEIEDGETPTEAADVDSEKKSNE